MKSDAALDAVAELKAEKRKERLLLNSIMKFVRQEIQRGGFYPNGGRNNWDGVFIALGNLTLAKLKQGKFSRDRFDDNPNRNSVKIAVDPDSYAETFALHISLRIWGEICDSNLLSSRKRLVLMKLLEKFAQLLQESTSTAFL